MCGITGIIYNKTNNGIEIYQSLLSIQHRGQDGAGIYWINKNNSEIVRKSGLINQIFKLEQLKAMEGNIYLAHNRYKTNNIPNSYQPFVFKNDSVGEISMCHNGNITNVDEIIALLKIQYDCSIEVGSDSYVLGTYISELFKKYSEIESISKELQNTVEGSFCILISIYNYGLIAIRDKYGIRPLSYGKNKDNDYLVSSETCSFNHTNFTFIDDIHPGETVLFPTNGRENIHYRYQYNHPLQYYSPCLFEYIYFSRVDSIINAISVYKFRFLLGELLGKYIDCSNIDCIVPTPETSRTYAYGLSNVLKLPIQEAVVLNRYVNRTFIGEDKNDIFAKVKQKFSVIEEPIRNKTILVLDDSIVRGNTSKGIVELLKKAEPKAIYFASAAPKIYDTNKYGIHIENKEELITFRNKTNEEIANFIGVEKIFYTSLNDVLCLVNNLNSSIESMETSIFINK